VFCSTAIALLPLQEIEDREQHKETDIWIEALQGYRYLWTNKPLLYLSIFMAWWNFILNGPLDLAIPYFLLRAGSISSMSILLGAMNAGALAGAIGAVWWGHFNLKLRFIVAGSLLTSSMFVLVGLSLPIWLLAASLFLLMLPLAVTGALFTSLLQQKTPFAMQGRVFTAFGQLSAATAPLSFLVTGPLVDQYLEPSMQAAKWELLNMLVGYDAGSGIGLLFVSCGFMLAGGVALMVASSKVRQIE
jgi:DHA3 family macrolide efflux protein-like MFS transporter